MLHSVDAKLFRVDARGPSPVLAASAKKRPTKLLPGADPTIHSPDLNSELFLSRGQLAYAEQA